MNEDISNKLPENSDELTGKKNNEIKKKFIRYIIAFALITVALYITLKDIDFYKLWQYIKNADYFWVIISIPIMIFSHWVRAMRWQTMLKPVAPKSSVWNLFSAVMIGYAANNILPRGGELLRPYVYARREKSSYSTAFATIVVERFIDIIILALMFGGVFFFFREQIKQALPNLHAEKFLIPVGIVILVLILSFWPPFVRFGLKKIIRPLSQKFYEKLSGIFDRFLLGFTIIRKPGQYLRLTIESLSIWLLYTIPMYLMFFSFSFDTKYGMGFDDAIFLIVISGIAFTVAPVPGALGIFHFFIQATLNKVYGINIEEALAYATVNHTVGYLVQTIIGGLFFLRENVKNIEKNDKEIQKEIIPPPEQN